MGNNDTIASTYEGKSDDRNEQSKEQGAPKFEKVSEKPAETASEKQSAKDASEGPDSPTNRKKPTRRLQTSSKRVSSLKVDPEQVKADEDWAQGWTDWMIYRKQHSTSVIPRNHKDQKLGEWARKQREDYSNFKKGHSTFLCQDGFAMMERMGFEWSDEEESQADEGSQADEESQAEKESQADEESQADIEKSAPPARSSTSEKSDNGEKDTSQTANTTRASKRTEIAVSEPLRKSRRTAKAPTLFVQETYFSPYEVGAGRERMKRTGTVPAMPSKVKSLKEEHSLPKIRPQGLAIRKFSEGRDSDSETGSNSDTVSDGDSDRTNDSDGDSDDTNDSHGNNALSKAEQKTIDFWKARMKELKNYKKATGHCCVPKLYPPNQRMSTWVYQQRKLMRGRQQGAKVFLSDERLEKLKKVGFVFNTRNNQQFWYHRADTYLSDGWDDQLLKLTAYMKKNGNCLVPKIYPEDQALAYWVARQRRQYRLMKADKLNLLSPIRLKKLQAINFCFNSKTVDIRRYCLMRRYDDNWDASWAMLGEFKKKHGHCNVPKRYPQNQSLAAWTQRQRSQYNRFYSLGLSSCLSEERIRKLKEIGFIYRLKGRAYSKADAGEGEGEYEGSVVITSDAGEDEGTDHEGNARLRSKSSKNEAPVTENEAPVKESSTARKSPEKALVKKRHAIKHIIKSKRTVRIDSAAVEDQSATTSPRFERSNRRSALSSNENTPDTNQSTLSGTRSEQNKRRVRLSSKSEKAEPHEVLSDIITKVPARTRVIIHDLLAPGTKFGKQSEGAAANKAVNDEHTKPSSGGVADEDEGGSSRRKRKQIQSPMKASVQNSVGEKRTERLRKESTMENEHDSQKQVLPEGNEGESPKPKGKVGKPGLQVFDASDAFPATEAKVFGVSDACPAAKTEAAAEAKAEEEAEFEEEAEQNGRGKRKGRRWKCDVCLRDNFDTFVAASAHEARCSGFIQTATATL